MLSGVTILSHYGLEENIRRRYVTESDGRFSDYPDEQLAAAIRRTDRLTDGGDIHPDPAGSEPVSVADIAGVDSGVYSELLNRYTDMMISKVVNITLSGVDAYDLMQVCAIGLLYAALSYSTEGGASFATYASRCIDNRIRTALKSGKRKKHLPLSGYSDIEEVGDTLFIDPDSDPETRALIDESVSEMTAQMSQVLSDTEHAVFADSLCGFSYQQISGHLGISVKAVDNALQRARRKLRVLFKKKGKNVSDTDKKDDGKPDGDTEET